MAYNFKKIEAKWQKAWAVKRVFEVKSRVSKTGKKGKKLGKSKGKFYCLEMFPYPSGSGLHMGHALNYSIGDIYARFKRMQGYNVLYPMGYDSFGLPAENAAIQAKTHPKKYTDASTANFTRQMKALGLSYDWSRTLRTSDPEYYRWNQFFFLKFFENGLVYRKEASVNWCPKCNTVLANEQVQGGKCWRHEDVEVQVKRLEQWFIETTRYADELLDRVDDLEWPDRIKTMQKNWIGKSHGTTIHFKINGEKWPIFTTRPDTVFGVTFMVVSAQHPRLMDLATPEQKKVVRAFAGRVVRSTSQKSGKDDELDKEGVFTGSYAVNPINGESVPVYAGNFVLAEYGSGMVMAVPAHDQRDFEFAKKYKIPIRVVVNSPDSDLNAKTMSRAFTGEGVLTNSEEFDGLSNKKAVQKITQYLSKNNWGRKTTQFKLRDWLVSRQRYWGTPIPIVYCDNCGVVPVPEKELPVVLPEKVKFGKGNPLAENKKFVEVKCYKCGKKARRETDTMDTFFDSSWYFLRYLDNKNKKEPFSEDKAREWMPVDQYIGGAEHACLHLIKGCCTGRTVLLWQSLGEMLFFQRTFLRNMESMSRGFSLCRWRRRRKIGIGARKGFREARSLFAKLWIIVSS
jgi:leucyl-tRNA synthetase